MELIVRHAGGVRFEAEARGHRLACDQPLSGGGADSGMTPPELMLASLGTCAGYYAAEYLRTRSLSAEGLTIKVEAEKAGQPARLGSFRIEVVVPGLDERHTEGIQRAVRHCLIHNTLLHPPAIETVVNTGAEALVG
jgi:putative redox protein